MRALVLGGGGLRGSYDGGVAATLCRELGPRHFKAIYGASAGVFTGAFYVANQPEVIEHVFRNVVPNGLVKYTNPLRGRHILDLEFLTEVFKGKQGRLDIEKLFSSPVKLTYVMTDYETIKPVYKSPTRENIFQLMKASAANVPFHGPVEIDGKKYIDGALTVPVPFQKALDDGYDDVLVITNKPEGFYVGKRFKRLMESLSRTFPKSKSARIMKSYEERVKAMEKAVEEDERIKVVRPSSDLDFKSIMDSKSRKVNLAFDRGIEDAKKYIKGK